MFPEGPACYKQDMRASSIEKPPAAHLRGVAARRA